MIIAQGKPVSGFGLAQYPEYKKLDQENNPGQTPNLTNPTQRSDTPQEEALRLDLWEVSKNPNYSKASVKKGTREDRWWFFWGINVATLILNNILGPKFNDLNKD